MQQRERAAEHGRPPLDAETLTTLKIASGEDAHLWRPLRRRPGFPGWTDDYASVLPLVEDWRVWLPNVLKGR